LETYEITIRTEPFRRRPQHSSLRCRLARRLLLARASWSPRYAGPTHSAGRSRRRANQLVKRGYPSDLPFGRPTATLAMCWMVGTPPADRPVRRGPPASRAPPFGPGGRRRANQLVLSLPPYCITPNNASGAAKPGTGPPNRTVKRTSLTPGPGSRTCLERPPKTALGRLSEWVVGLRSLSLRQVRAPGPSVRLARYLGVRRPSNTILRNGSHRPDFAATRSPARMSSSQACRSPSC